MKKFIGILLVVLIFEGCKNDTPSNSTNQLLLKNRICLVDDVGKYENNSAGIKVTILGINKVTYTDSLGDYEFTDVPEGTYDVKYEYKNYPVLYAKRNEVIYYQKSIPNGFNNTRTILGQFSIGPSSSLKFTIDTAYFYNNSYIFRYSIIGTKPFNMAPYIVLLSKTLTYLDYSKEQYMLLQCGPYYLFSDTTKMSDFWRVLDIKGSGFGIGDSIYIRIYPISSLSYYTDDPNNAQGWFFPSYGESSNVYANMVR